MVWSLGNLPQTFIKIGAIVFEISLRFTDEQTEVKTQPPGGGNKIYLNEVNKNVCPGR